MFSMMFFNSVFSVVRPLKLNFRIEKFRTHLLICIFTNTLLGHLMKFGYVPLLISIVALGGLQRTTSNPPSASTMPQLQ